MGAALGLSERDFVPFVERYAAEVTTNGLSLVAAPAADPGTLAGVFINHDFKSAPPPGVPDDFPWFPPIRTALMTVVDEYEKRRPGIGVGDAVELMMVAVVPSGPFARKGIAGELFRLSAQVAREKGFRRCVTEFTGAYSQAAAVKNGFEEVARMPYADFRYEGRAVFANIPAPHTDLILYEKGL